MFEHMNSKSGILYLLDVPADLFPKHPSLFQLMNELISFLTGILWFRSFL